MVLLLPAVAYASLKGNDANSSRKEALPILFRLRELGVGRITGTLVYKWNIASQKMHGKLGFVRVAEDGDDYLYELVICGD